MFTLELLVVGAKAAELLLALLTLFTEPVALELLVAPLFTYEDDLVLATEPLTASVLTLLTEVEEILAPLTIVPLPLLLKLPSPP